MFKYYESLGIVDLREMTLAGSQPNDPILANMYLYGHAPMDQVWYYLTF